MKHPIALAVGGALVSSILGGCAFAEHRRYQAAEAEYRECLDAHPRSPSKCEPLRATRDQAYENYERAAGRSWSCNQTAEGCDTDSLPNRTP